MSTPAFLIQSAHGQTLALDIALPGQSVSQSVRERERERGRERKRERVRKRERERESKKEGGERDVEYGCFIFIFNRNDGCLGRF